MTLEILFPELANLYGESANGKYLAACAPSLGLQYTENTAVPLFASGQADMIYLGSMTESGQELALRRLLPYRQQLWERIEAGTVVLATGNALELFGQEIQDGQTRIPALGYFPFSACRHLENPEVRHNSMFLGHFGDMPVVGCKSQFSHCTGSVEPAFLEVDGGFGSVPGSRQEGLHYRNLFATYLLGPLLIRTPPLARYLLGLLGFDGPLALEQEAMQAYHHRLQELRQEGVCFRVGEHG